MLPGVDPRDGCSVMGSAFPHPVARAAGAPPRPDFGLVSRDDCGIVSVDGGPWSVLSLFGTQPGARSNPGRECGGGGIARTSCYSHRACHPTRIARTSSYSHRAHFTILASRALHHTRIARTSSCSHRAHVILLASRARHATRIARGNKIARRALHHTRIARTSS